MIGRYLLLAASSGVACASVVVALFALGLGHPEGLWSLAVGGAALVVAFFERARIRRVPVDAERPGIVPGDE